MIGLIVLNDLPNAFISFKHCQRSIVRFILNPGSVCRILALWIAGVAGKRSQKGDDKVGMYDHCVERCIRAIQVRLPNVGKSV